MFDLQLSGALTLVLVGTVTMAFGDVLPEWAPIAVAAVIGSGQAVSARISKKYVKGFWAVVWAFLAGVSCGVFVGQSVGAIFSLTMTGGIVLPVYIFALMGGRLVMWFSVGVSVEAIGTRIVEVLTGKK